MVVRFVHLAALAVCLSQQVFAQDLPQLPTIEMRVEVVGGALADFTSKMDAYDVLRRSLQAGLPELRVTDKPAEIHQAEQLLAARIREARAGARRGDIFTEQIRRAFRQVLRPVANAITCEVIRADNPGEFPYQVNAAYPKTKPLSTVPASMLAVLPRLPDDVWYRFLERDLILHDSRANIILDRIDDAIRCDD
jgi:hypothetical protein